MQQARKSCQLFSLLFSPGFSCNFDGDLCGFTQSRNDKFDWTQNSGSTPSGGTGPIGDHTSGKGEDKLGWKRLWSVITPIQNHDLQTNMVARSPITLIIISIIIPEDYCHGYDQAIEFRSHLWLAQPTVRLHASVQWCRSYRPIRFEEIVNPHHYW